MREWKGLKNQLVDYKYWLKNYGMAMKLILRHPVKFYHTLMKYPWVFDDLKMGNFIKLQTDGYKGTHLKIMHILYAATAESIFRNVRHLIEAGDDIIVTDEIVPRDIFAAMGLKTVAPESAGFTVSMVDQNSITKYLDFMENLGVPNDVCSLPMSQAAVVLNNEVPEKIAAYVMTNAPCDGKNVVNQFFERHWPNTPQYLCEVPDFIDEEGWATELAEKSLWGLIAFLEKTTGHKMNWDLLRENCDRYNEVTEIDLLKWDYAKTDKPVISGCTLWLPRLIHYTMGPGELCLYKANKQIVKLMEKAYEEGEQSHPKRKFRAIVWNCPPNIYTMFMSWLEKCWGVSVLCDLESYVSTELIDTTSKESMVKGISKKYALSTMFKHTHGGIHRNLGDMIHVAKEFRADFIINANQISCRAQSCYSGLFEEESRKHGFKLCWFDQDLLDKRIISRQEMRDQMNDFMFNVMQAEPIDASLLEINDQDDW